MVADEKFDATNVVSEYSNLQARLVAATRLAYPSLDKDLIGINRVGNVCADDETWAFALHGVGVRYVGTRSGRIVDVHVQMIEHPDAVDAWRLEQYLESIPVAEVWFENECHRVAEEGGVDLLLATMATRGAIERVQGRHPLFVLSKKYSLSRRGPEDAAAGGASGGCRGQWGVK